MNLDEYGGASKGLIWDAIERGLPIEKYIDKKHFSFMTLNYLITVLSAKHDLDDFPFEEYNDEQIQQLLAAVYFQKNWKEWANPKMNSYIMSLFVTIDDSQAITITKDLNIESSYKYINLSMTVSTRKLLIT